ncbi:hypothetical protein D3C78_1554150 [compost metagenome]
MICLKICPPYFKVHRIAFPLCTVKKYRLIETRIAVYIWVLSVISGTSFGDGLSIIHFIGIYHLLYRSSSGPSPIAI